MIDLKAFRKANKLTQKDLAAYLGILQGFVSQMENNERPIPANIISKLISNPHGWDTSSLAGGPSINATANNNSKATVTINASKDAEIAILKEKVASLEKMLEEEKQRSAQYWEMIQKLMK